MAGIDYTIPNQFKGIQLESPMNAMAQAMQLRNLQESSQMNALKFQEAQREAQERNALAKLDPSSPQYIAQLTRISPELALRYQKAAAETKSAVTTQQKHESDLFDARLKQSRYFLESIDPNSPTAAQQYLAWHIANHKDPVLGPVLASRGADEVSARARIDEAIKTGKLPELITQSKLGMEKFYELTPAFNKAEKEQIDQEYSDYLNTPGNPSLTRLQFIEARKRQRAAAPAPAPDAAVASANLLGSDPNMVVTKEPVDSQGQNRPPFNKTEPLGNKVAYTDEAAAAMASPVVQPARDDSKIAPAFITGANNLAPAVNGRLPSIMWSDPNVNNLGTVPTFTTAGANKVASQVTPQVTATSAAKTADVTAQPTLHPDAAKLYQSNLPGDKAKADAIQRVHEAQLRAGVALSEIAQLQDDRAKALQRGDKKSANEITARINKLIKTDEPPINPAQTALISKAILDGRLDPNKVNSRNMAIIANTLEIDPTANLKELNIDSVSAAAASKALATQSAKTLAAATEANDMIPIVRNASAKVDRSKYPDLNAIQNAVAKKTGGPEIVSLNTAINALVNSYARAINPTGVATVSDKNHAREILNSAYSNGQLNAILNTMQQEMVASKEAPGRAAAELKAGRNRPAGTINRNVPQSTIRSKADEIIGR